MVICSSEVSMLILFTLLQNTDTLFP
uniref:Uncharacterized protein n=1 Tax=Arundo donax TaxID=35708 RepID=A0A0A9BJT3_ARUDO